MDPDRKIGRIVKVNTNRALVELASDTSSYVKSNIKGLYEIGVVNSYVVIPVGPERVVALVTSIDMSEEPEATFKNRQMLVLPQARRTMWLSMVGTISQSGTKKQFDFGVRRYPELDNPVWFATEEDLDAIFERECSDKEREKRLISIGRSPIFQDYDIKIDMDKFFGKHGAVLGNTGSGKSCTVTAIIKAVLGAGPNSRLPHAHFLIFDTNSEYTAAFTDTSKDPPVYLYNRLVLTNESDTPHGFWLPHWFMNGRDYHAFFRPGEGAQGPLLFRAIGSARASHHAISARIEVVHVLEQSLAGIETLIANPPTGNQAGFGLDKVRELITGIQTYLIQRNAEFTAAGLQQLNTDCQATILTLLQQTTPPGQFAQITAPIIASVNDGCRQLRQHILQHVQNAQPTSQAPIGIDTPSYFDFNEFVEDVFRQEVERESQNNANIRNWVGTLLMRLQQAQQDPRYEFLFGVPAFSFALASFMRMLLGVHPAEHFDTSGARAPWAEYYLQQHPGNPGQHNVTIIDLSRLASDVLENVTALLGRLVLEFMQRCPQRGDYPIVMVLEEAHRYIPAQASLERQQRAREVFERIAKEGRKYGLSLLIASQRPSELSKTVISQCNSFVIHRIQNPDDRDYFRSVIPDINRDLLEQLPSLPQQHALVLGDCITIPLQVRIHDVYPKPHSKDPEFYQVWSNANSQTPDFEDICGRWEGSGPIETAVADVDGEEQDQTSTTESDDLDAIFASEDEIPF